MGDRRITNILLAIIAGVLLFGSSAVAGALQWLALGGLALLILYAGFKLIAYCLRGSATALSEAKDRDTFVLTIFGLVALAWLPVLVGSVVMNWMRGTPNPIAVVSDSWVGNVWLGIIGAGAIAAMISRLITRREYIIPTLRYGLRLLIRAPIAPVFMSIYGWRKARTAGDGVISSAATAFLGLFFGLLFWMIALVICISLFKK